MDQVITTEYDERELPPEFHLAVDGKATFVWAPDAKTAVKLVSRRAGVAQYRLPAKYNGAYQAATYDYSGSEADGYTEIYGATVKRYRVKGGVST